MREEGNCIGEDTGTVRFVAVKRLLRIWLLVSFFFALKDHRQCIRKVMALLGQISTYGLVPSDEKSRRRE